VVAGGRPVVGARLAGHAGTRGTLACQNAGMRRYLILIAAAGALFVGCSSSNETSTSSSTTTSSVVITPANEKACADLKEFRDGLQNSIDTGGFKVGATPGETATQLQGLFAKTLPSLQTLKLSAPADLAPAVDVYIVQFTEAGTLNPADTEDQQKLSSMLMAPNPELKEAETTLRTWSSNNCGLALPGAQS